MHKSADGKTIAAGLIAEVAHCAGCNILHLHLGAITLRLKPAAVHDLRDTLSRALAALPPHEDADAARDAESGALPVSTCH